VTTYDMSESQHSTADFGMSENSVGRGMALAIGKGGCVGGGVTPGRDESAVELLVGPSVVASLVVSLTVQHNNWSGGACTYEQRSPLAIIVPRA
jgi:hypothetical protein